MATYKPFLIQKLKPNSSVRDTREWNIFVKSVPFKLFPAVKEPFKRSWFDEHGDDEYIPDNPVYEAYEMDCKFVYIGNHGTANEYIQSFLKYLAEGGMFSMYDTYTGIGRTNVRYVRHEEEILYRYEDENDVVVFSVKLKVNDPITEVKLVAEEPLERWLRFISDNGGNVTEAKLHYESLHPLIKNEAKTILYPSVVASSVVYGLDRKTGFPIGFTFSRSSQATYFDKDVNMHLAPVNMPRIDYKNYGDSANILIEKEATNYIRSSDFKEGSDNLLTGSSKVVSLDVFSFIKSGARIEKTTTASSAYKRPIVETGLRYNFSLYLEGDENLNVTDSIGQQDNPNLDVVFYLNASTSQTSLVKKKISEDYLRLSKSGILTTDNAHRGLIKYSGMSDKPIVATGYQLEFGDTPTSYIPTENMTATRTAEYLSYRLTKNCSVYMKTTKQNVVLDKPTGLWNIESDLNNEGIITIAIFDRILTDSEKSQLIV